MKKLPLNTKHENEMECNSTEKLQSHYENDVFRLVSRQKIYAH